MSSLPVQLAIDAVKELGDVSPEAAAAFALGFVEGLASSTQTEPSLEDSVCCISPYFKVHKVDQFKALWKAAFDPFAHKEDAVYYAFTFREAEDGITRAHCREAYTSADTVLQHLADVDGPLNAVLADGIAELERLEARGPAAEIEKLREPLGAFGCIFYTAEWGFRPNRAPQPNADTVCHLYPYFKLKDAAKFKAIWREAYPSTKANADAEKSHQYAFCFTDDDGIALCREAYGDAEGLLLHVKNVGPQLGLVLDPAVAELLRLEIHAPANQMEALKAGTAGLPVTFFTTAWGFRN
jgi:hypothetical protein